MTMRDGGGPGERAPRTSEEGQNDDSERQRLQLFPRTAPMEEQPAQFVRNTAIFGMGRPREEVLKVSGEYG